MDWFGLGIMLNARDNASGTILRVNQALDSLSNKLKVTGSEAQQEVQRINDAMSSIGQNVMVGLGLQQIGQEFMQLSGGIMSPLIDLEKKSVETGAQFEKWRFTLKALYKDSDIAKSKAQEAMNLAAKTPFEIGDVMEAVIGFKSMGTEALQLMENVEGAQGEARTLLEYVGDLASLRPDKSLQDILVGVRNLVGGDGGRSLRLRMDMDFEGIMGEDWASEPEEIMQQLANVSQKIAGGLMKELEGTWGHIISNLDDQATRFFLSIADGGAFDKAKSTLKYFADAIETIDDDRLATIGKNIASAFEIIWKPIDFVIRRIIDLGMAIVKLVETSPLFAKLVVGFVSALGILTALTGMFLVFGGTALIVVNGVKYILLGLGRLVAGLSITTSAIASFILKSSKMLLIGALLYKAWKSDFGGVRSVLQSFMNNIHKAFSYSTEIANMGTNDMMNALAGLEKTTFTGWLTYQLVKLKVFWMGLVDAWNDYTLSDENFQKLNALGLLPLLETILDLKLRFEAFWEGFTLGLGKVSEFVKWVINETIELIHKIIKLLSPVEEGVEGVDKTIKELDLQPWRDFGEISAYIVSSLAGLFILSSVIGFITKIGGAIMKVIGFIGSIGKGVMAILGFFGKVWGFIEMLLVPLALLGEAILTFFGLGATAAGLSIGALALIPIAIAVAVGLIIKYWDEIVEFFKWSWNIIVEASKTAWEGMKTAWKVSIEFLKEKWQGVVDFFVGIWDKITEVIANFKDKVHLIFTMTVQKIQNVWEDITTFFQELWDKVSEIVSTFAQNIIDFFQPVINFFVGLGMIIFGLFRVAFNLVLGAITIAVASIILVVGLIIEGVVYVAKKIVDFFKWAWDGIVSGVGIAVENIKTFMSNSYDNIVTVWTNVKTFFKDMWDYVYTNVIQPVWNNITTFIGQAYDKVAQVWQGVKGVFSEIWTYVLDTVIMPIWNTISSCFSTAYDGLVIVWTNVTEFFNTLWEGVKVIVQTAWDFIKECIDTVYNGVVVIWTGITDFFTTLWEGVKVIVSVAWEFIKGIIKTVYDGVVVVWNGITSFFSTLWGGVQTATSYVWEGISSFITGIYNTVSSLWEGIVGVFDKVWGAVKTSATVFFDWLGSKFSWVTEVIDGVKTAFSGIGNGISGGLESIKNGAKKMVGLNTGGYVKTEGIAMLHPNEVVVNDEITQGLKSFLEEREKGTALATPLIQQAEPVNNGTPVTRNVSTNEQVYNSISNVSYDNSRSTEKSSTSEKVDNSITFSQGAIQITMTDGNEQDIEKLFKKISEKLKKENALRSTLNYKPKLV